MYLCMYVLCMYVCIMNHVIMKKLKQLMLSVIASTSPHLLLDSRSQHQPSMIVLLPSFNILIVCIFIFFCYRYPQLFSDKHDDKKLKKLLKNVMKALYCMYVL